MGIAASSDLLVQASITENTPGGNCAKTWHPSVRLSWHVDLPYTFKLSWRCIHPTFRHPPLILTRLHQQLQRAPRWCSGNHRPGWSPQKTSTYGTKALIPNTPYRLQAPYEDREGAKLCAQLICDRAWLERYLFVWRSSRPVNRHHSAPTQKKASPVKNRTPHWRLGQF